jgi:hypothetical protein
MDLDELYEYLLKCEESVKHIEYKEEEVLTKEEEHCSHHK